MEWCMDLPWTLLTDSRWEVFRTLASEMKRRVCGQAEAINRLSAAVQRRELGAVPPLGRERCLIFAGPTGVGKTETARALAELVFGEGHLHRFDCGEFRTPEAVASLLGNRVGDRGRFGQAFDAVSKGVWLLDELEKAHPEFMPLLMAMTDAGRLTLASGETLDLSGLYLIATSNLGSAEILGRQHVPFATLEKHVIRSIHRHFRPELVARFLTPLVFRPLDPDTQIRVVALHLNRFVEWHAQRGVHVQAGVEVLRFLVQAGHSSRLGARPLIDAIHQHVGDALASHLLGGGGGRGHLVVVGNRLRLVE